MPEFSSVLSLTGDVDVTVVGDGIAWLVAATRLIDTPDSVAWCWSVPVTQSLGSVTARHVVLAIPPSLTAATPHLGPTDNSTTSASD